MADYLVTDTDLTSIASAIRTKGGTSAQLTFPGGFVDAVGAIPTGGTTPTGTKQISISASGTITEDVTNYANVEVSVPQGSAGTPTAVKGTMSNNSISVTPSVTNTTGFITGGTKTGTPVSVSASELVSGTRSITQNGTGIDVTNYAYVDVNVSGGGGSSSHTVRVSLGNPINGWEFSGCLLKDGGMDGTQIGTIGSPTGKTTVTVTTGVLYIEFASESGLVEFDKEALLFATSGTEGLTGLSEYYDSDSTAFMFFAVAGNGDITLDSINYDA